jgi:uroporphyrinogen III methyltransferase/synthase
VTTAVSFQREEAGRIEWRMSDSEPKVFLVGAGPGNPGLLTLRAVECLSRADLILYDQLAGAQLLEHTRPGAACVCVSELGPYAERRPLIHRAMIDAARQGKVVVRLKGGDPFLFGRGGEEAEALRAAGVAYEVVPGVTAGLGAAAFAGIPLTHRSYSSAVAFVTGHEDPAKQIPSIDWEALARFPGTLVFYMGVARLGGIASALIAHGKAPDTPAALVHWATTPRQRTLVATLDGLAEEARVSEVTAPSLVIIGPVVALRERIQWFERRPLFGKRVLVTRPRHQAGEMMRRLEELGAVPFALPAIEIREPKDWSPVDAALARLSGYQWLVFTSVNGVRFFFRRLLETGRDLRAVGAARLAAIGPSTADALRSFHLTPDLIPARYCSESLAAALRERAAGQRVLLVRADRGRELLREVLAQSAHVDQVAVYGQVESDLAGSEGLDLLRSGKLDYVTLTSSNIAKSLIRALDQESRDRIASGQVALVSISPVTSGTVRDMGLPVAAEATEYTTKGLIDALVRLVGLPSA